MINPPQPKMILSNPSVSSSFPPVPPHRRFFLLVPVTNVLLFVIFLGGAFGLFHKWSLVRGSVGFFSPFSCFGCRANVPLRKRPSLAQEGYFFYFAEGVFRPGQIIFSGEKLF